MTLIDSVKPEQIAEFLSWIDDSFTTDAPKSEGGDAPEDDAAMQAVVLELRSKVPLSAVLSSERTMFPEYGVDSDCNPNTTVHIDSFLYDDDDLDELVDQGLISRHYCRACGSHTTAPLTFISHSFSVWELRYVFTRLIPPDMLRGKTLVDVGSRLGSVLFAANIYSPQLSQISGIEMNEDLCKIAQETLTNHGMTEKTRVVCDDVINRAEEVRLADLIVLNNVFQFFIPPQQQTVCWRFIREHAKQGAILVTNPSLPSLTGHLDLGFTIEDWVDQAPTETTASKYAGTDGEKFEDLKKICLYQVR